MKRETANWLYLAGAIVTIIIFPELFLFMAAFGVLCFAMVGVVYAVIRFIIWLY